MNPNDELADKLFAGEELETFRRTSLERGLALMKARRRRRTVLRVSAVALLPICLALMIWKQRASVALPRQMAASGNVASANVSRIHLINNDDLATLFPNRPFAIIGPPGR